MTPEPTSNSKLRRVLDEYDLENLGEEIEVHWLDDTDSRYSLRELTLRQSAIAPDSDE